MISAIIEFNTKYDKILALLLLKRYSLEINYEDQILELNKPAKINIIDKSKFKLDDLTIEIKKNDKFEFPILRLVDFFDRNDRNIENLSENKFMITYNIIGVELNDSTINKEEDTNTLKNSDEIVYIEREFDRIKIQSDDVLFY